jgi:hypothetical protein
MHLHGVTTGILLVVDIYFHDDDGLRDEQKRSTLLFPHPLYDLLPTFDFILCLLSSKIPEQVVYLLAHIVRMGGEKDT